MKVIEKNVMTGKVTERDYMQKELDDINASIVADAPARAEREKKKDIDLKREEAIEELITSGTSAKARAYQDAIKT